MLERTSFGSAGSSSRRRQLSLPVVLGAISTIRRSSFSPESHFMIEQAPVPDLQGERRGVVAEGSSRNALAWPIPDLPL